MILIRFIGYTEYYKLMNGETILPLPHSKTAGNTSLKYAADSIIFFFPIGFYNDIDDLYSIIDEYHNFVNGVVDDNFVVVIEKDDDELIYGRGVYSNSGYTIEELEELGLEDEQSIVEAGVGSYNLENDVDTIVKLQGGTKQIVY